MLKRATSRKKRPVDERWTCAELAVFDALSSPLQIQGRLESTPYSPDPIYRSPRSVLRDRKAHCFDGALFAAAALARLGHRPLLVDLRAANDDDHVLAVYQVDGHWGAVAKSNFVGLRFREPIYRTLRELALSYFEVYFNSLGQKTLREYSLPLDLRAFDDIGWRTSDEHLERIATRLDEVRHFPVLTRRMIARLSPADERSVTAGMLGVDEAGLFQPKR
ncbi:MAG TPA: hypothetical protein DFS52_25970 [Myxococcales bacterium]|jgi:glycine/D-amino acid oxidase-like deaminating enzyme|nr:hypothetical protein [Myxococcales bacterium]